MESSKSFYTIFMILMFCGNPWILTQVQGAARHIFDDLTSNELQEVIDYLYRQPDLNLVRGKEGLSIPYLRMIEAVSPTKAKALNHIDNGGPMPERRASAIIYRGDLEPPVVQELTIWPIPSPRRHKLYKNSKWRDPIPFPARSPLYSLELALVEQRLQTEMAKVDHIVQDATGYRFNNCSTNCLTFAPAGPPHTRSGGHKMLGYLIRKIEGGYLHPIGLQFLLNMEGTNLNEWTISYVLWQGQAFRNFDDMKQAYESNHLKTQKLPIPPNVDNEKLRSSLNFRGEPRPAGSQRGRVSYSPDGNRFIVSERQVQWVGWTFNFNVRSSTGIQIHDVRFLGERIAYELSLQELVVQYSGGDPVSSHTLFFDSDAMLGFSGTKLFPGVDCPSDAKFFDTVHLLGTEPHVFKDTVCLFEWDRGIPLRRHYSNDGGGNFHYQGMPDNVLVLRSVPVIDNYDYVIDLIFHQDGKLEVKTSLTGYVVSTMYNSQRQDKYGYLVEDKTIGNIHIHLANFRVDLDVLGTNNRLVTLDLKAENIEDSLNPGQKIVNMKLDRNLRQTELQAAYKFNFDTPKYIVFFNEQKKNRFGNPRGYRLHISDMGKLLLPSDYRLIKSLTWAEYQMLTTKYDEEELRSSSLYNYMEPFNPIFTVQDYIDDDQNIVDEDLVAWVTLAAHHIPHTEDVPIVTTPGVQLTFYLLPFNFFDEDPSLASRDNIRVEQGPDKSYIYKYAGVGGGEHCKNEDIQCEGTSEVSSAPDLPFLSHGLLVLLAVYILNDYIIV